MDYQNVMQAASVATCTAEMPNGMAYAIPRTIQTLKSTYLVMSRYDDSSHHTLEQIIMNDNECQHSTRDMLQ